jgi:hypothetical protein
MEDDSQFAALAGQMRSDLLSDLARYEIGDHATLKQYFTLLGSLALIDGDLDGAVAWADSVRRIEDKPGVRALVGTLERAMRDAATAAEAQRDVAFREAYSREISALEWNEVQAELRTLKGFTEMGSAAAVRGYIQAQVEPAARGGEISLVLAAIVVDGRRALEATGRYQDEMIDVLAEAVAANTVEKPDIWAARDVSLEGRTDLTPVRIGIWDTGVDVALFEGRLFVNADEIPGNGVDDDRNGFVDDVHGIAHDLQLRRTTGSLKPVGLTPAEEASYRSHLKGFTDVQAGIESLEASEFKHLVRELAPETFGPFFESFNEFVSFTHGTHVAGIALAGNPAARIVVGRYEDDQRLVPALPTIEQAQAWAREFRDKVGYFREHGVRVVNMSWGFSAADLESALEMNNAGGSAEERAALAKSLFDIQVDALREVFTSAPDILFVAAAGNEDADNRFAFFAPASIDLPNVISAAAVDRAGDEAAFTSYGKVEIWANGYEVSSLLPGGETGVLSGTSMAAPQVTNLAAKLLAIDPDLSVAELRRLILEAADETVIGDSRRIRLLNPRRSVERLGG